MFQKNILFNVETMLFYEVTPLVYDLVSLIADPTNTDPLQFLKTTYTEEDIKNAAVYLMQEGFLKEGTGATTPRKKPVLKKRRGIRHLELMVTHACSMRCRYCYGSLGQEEWQTAPYLYGADAGSMSFKTAKEGVDFLFETSGRQKNLSVIFFGGEPLLAFDLIEKIVPYVRQREAETGKKVDFSLSTNGLRLSEQVVDFLRKNKVGCQVSIDGPKEIHDKNRRLADGKGSFDYILPGIKRLISIRPGKVPARATVSHTLVNLPAVVKYLLSLGFGSVHIEPVIGGNDNLSVSQEDIETIKRQNETIALFLVESVKNNRFFNYTNLVRFIRHTRVVKERLAHYCGAGRTYFALSRDGVFYPCHRFVGLDEYRMGDVQAGIDQRFQQKILDLTVDNRPVCRECWARYLCGGGCWKHAVDVNGGLEIPDNNLSCEITRHLIECAMAINSELKVSDTDILTQLYEETAEPYLVTEQKEGSHGEKGVFRVAV